LEAEGALDDEVHSLIVSFAVSNSFLMREHPAEAAGTG
jgi:hypothetical protein